MNSAKPGVPTRRASLRSSGNQPTIRYERAAWNAGYTVVAGVDEVGRGAWAGPLVAAALILPMDPTARARLTRALNRHGLSPRDSKQLNHQQRVDIVDVLDDHGWSYETCEIQVPSIDAIGVGKANLRALGQAVRELPGVDYALIDAFSVRDLACACHPVVGGDRVCMSIALASIVAKVHRDRLMVELDVACPGYGFSAHKGYGTAAHRLALQRLGVSQHHRRSFRPVAEQLVSI